jgi:hypothetical protein
MIVTISAIDLSRLAAVGERYFFMECMSSAHAPHPLMTAVRARNSSIGMPHEGRVLSRVSGGEPRDASDRAVRA